MSTPYEARGRIDQKLRTRNALINSAQRLVGDGVTPTVERAAAAAGVSRTAAYRYFPNQRALLVAAHPETAARSLLPADPPEDVESRLAAVVAQFTQLIISTELAQRTMLRLSLAPDQQRGNLPLRQGRAIAWIEEALSPLRGTLSDQALRRLALAIRSTIGIEALVWLTDIARLSRPEAVELMSWSARALLWAALDGRTRCPSGPIPAAEPRVSSSPLTGCLTPPSGSPPTDR